MLYCVGSLVFIPLTEAFISLPKISIIYTALFLWGIWASLLALPVAVLCGYGILILYLGLIKRILLPDSGGEHAIFLSLGAGKWQLLCILAYLYNDFIPLMGSQVSGCMGAFTASSLVNLLSLHPVLLLVPEGDGRQDWT